MISSLKRLFLVKNTDMKKSAFFSDVIFAFFGSFLFSVCLFRYEKIPLLLAFVLAILCGVLLAAAVAAYLQSKRKNLFLKKSDETQKEKLLLHLALLSEEKQTSLFKDAIPSEEPLQRFGRLRLYSKTKFYFLNFRLTPVNADDIAKYARLKTGKEKILLCSNVEDSSLGLCAKLNIHVKTGDDVYLLLKEHNKLPESFLGEESGENKRKRRFKSWFSKKNGKAFSIGGFMLLFTSFLTPFPYYYLIFGGGMLLASALIRIFGHE